MAFDYFYGAQSQQFAFYRIPKVLFIDNRFQNISTEGKVLYGLLLDRVSLSMENGWIDDEGRVYIIFTLTTIRQAMNCAEKSAIKYLTELEEFILDVVCSKRKIICIAGDVKSVNVVKGRFMKLNMEHIRYVMNCMQENTTKIRSIKQYMLAALYNAPATIDSYYRAEVNHDMAEGRI